ncbi:hypothetical protein FQA39_LY10523 [Lamprigera yunnana]|nr:hypothetical protein FQA39_LY10523 [Lamprigera yunnana]
MRTKYKNEIWDKIAVDLNYSNDLWRKLRDCHRNALRRQKKFKSGDNAKKVKVWRYQKQMEFLVPYMANRNTSSNVESSQQDETENLTDNDTIHSPSSKTPADEQNEDEYEEVDAENVQKSSQDTTVQVSARATLKTGKRRKQMETLLQQTLEDHIVRRRQREEERKRKTDSLFFLSMYHDTKEMPHISQLRIKRKLFKAVQVEENVIAVSRESAMLQQSNTTHSLSPQSSVELSSRVTSSSSRYEQELQPMLPYIAQQSFDVHRSTPHLESRSSYLGNMSLSSCYENFDPTLTYICI